MAQPAGLLYSKEHEWVKLDGDVATIGVTDYAQSQLGDVVFIGVVESVKAVSDIFTPVGGEVIAINDAIEADPALVNREPYDGGWFYKVKLGDVSQSAELMSPEQYDRLISQT